MQNSELYDSLYNAYRNKISGTSGVPNTNNFSMIPYAQAPIGGWKLLLREYGVGSLYSDKG